MTAEGSTQSLYEKLVIEAMKEIIRANLLPDERVTSRFPNVLITNGRGQVTPYYIGLQARLIASEMMLHCWGRVPPNLPATVEPE